MPDRLRFCLATLVLLLAAVQICGRDVLGSSGIDRVPPPDWSPQNDSLWVRYYTGSPFTYSTFSDTSWRSCRSLLVGSFVHDFEDCFAVSGGEYFALRRAQRSYVVGSVLCGIPAAVLFAVAGYDLLGQPQWHLETTGIACLAVAVPLLAVDIVMGINGNRQFRLAMNLRHERLSKATQR